MANLPHITNFGLPEIDRIPFGMHTCHFYSNRDQLVAALVPYFVAGLHGNERCFWVTASPLSVREAVAALGDAWNGVEEAIETNALRILDFDQWYASSAGLKGLDVVQLWLKEEECALAEGYKGLRIAGNASPLKWGEWSTFMEYEQAVTAHFKSRRIIALCSYALMRCTDQQISEVLHAHHGALQTSDDDYWRTMIYPELGFEEDIKQSPTEHGELSVGVESETETRFCEPNQALLDELTSLVHHSASDQEMEQPGEALRKSEKRFCDMIDVLPAAIYTTDAEGRLTHFNPAAVEFSGRIPRLGTDEWCVSWKLYHADGTPMPHDECPMAVALKEGRIVRGVEAIAERPDGTRVWFTPYPTPLRDAGGRIVGGINMLVDITERKRDADVKARLAAIVESSDDAIVSKNLNGIITSWNRGAERIFGYTTQEAIGQPVTILMPPDRANEESDILMRIRRGEKIDHYETIRRRKDGTLLNISLAVSPIIDANGRVIGASKIARDITERKRTEEALWEAQLRLQQWNAELEQAVNIKTVELRHSQERLRALTAELNITEQRERKRLAVELHDNLQQMLVLGKLKLGQGKRLAETVPMAAKLMQEADDVLSDALKYSRTLVTELSPPVLRDHGLPAGLKWLGEYMPKHNVTVTVTVPDEELKLPEDQVVLLFQSVRELLINSSKHAGTGEATVAMEHRDGLLRIEVRDEGVGFDLAAAAETSSGDVLSKFGLFSIRERMRALGGSLEIESAPGKGTTATLTLALRDDVRGKALGVRSVEERARTGLMPKGLGVTAKGDSVVASRLPTDDSRPIRVLLVDDHIMVRQGLKAVLDAYADVELIGEAGNGEEAVRLVDQLRPAVVVMDINIPTMNGVEATEVIKSRYPETIVIGLSVNAAKENEEAMKQAGAVRLMTKEAAVEQLYDVIVEAAKQERAG